MIFIERVYESCDREEKDKSKEVNQKNIKRKVTKKELKYYHLRKMILPRNGKIIDTKLKVKD